MRRPDIVFIWSPGPALTAEVDWVLRRDRSPLRSPPWFCVALAQSWWLVFGSCPTTEVSSWPGVFSASRSPLSVGWSTPAACKQSGVIKRSLIPDMDDVTVKSVDSDPEPLTWQGFGRRIRRSTARWTTLRASRWWNVLNAVCPACSSPGRPASPGCSGWTHTIGLHVHVTIASSWGAARKEAFTHLLYEQFLAHTNAFIQAFLVLFK